MKSAQQSSSFEMGITSIVSILSGMANDTIEGNIMFEELTAKVSSLSDNILTTLNNNSSNKFIESLNLSEKPNFQKTLLLSVSNISAGIEMIVDMMLNQSSKPEPVVIQEDKSSWFAKLMAPPKPTTMEPEEVVPKQTKQKDSKGTDKILTDILKVVQEIAAKGSKSEKSGDGDSKTNIFNIGGLVDAITTMSKTFTNKFFKQIDRFNLAIEKMLSFDAKKVLRFNVGMEKFLEIVEKLDKKLKPATLSMIGFAGAFAILAFVSLSPMLSVSLLMLTGFVWLLQKITSDKAMPKNMLEFSGGIAILALSMVAFTFVPYAAMFKGLLFIAAITFILRKRGSNDTPATDLIKFAAGIGILTLAMIAMQFVPVSAMFMMLGFIGGLGIVLKYFQGRGPSPIMEFALGIGVLTLGLIAFAFIPVVAMIKMIGFIAALGLTLKLFNRPEGPMRMPSLIGFAFGLGLMALAILVFDELPLVGMLKVLGFVLVLGLELAVINKIGGAGPMKGLPGFAFGLAIMTLAMYAMNELPFSAMVTTLLFIGGLGLVLKLYSQKSGIMMLLIGAGIAAISIGLLIFKKSGFEFSDGLAFGGTLLILAGIMVGIGFVSIPALLGAATMIAIAASSLLIGLSLWAISKLKVSNDDIFEFVKSIGLITFGFAALTPFALLAIVTSVMLIPLGVSAILIAGSLAVISQLKFNGISEFVEATTSLAINFARILPEAILGAITAVLFIPISVSALLAAGALFAIGNLEIKSAKIAEFSTGMKYILDGFGQFGLIEMGKGVIKAGLMVPIMLSAMLAAVALKTISSLNVSEDKIKVFGDVLSSFTTIMVDSLTANADRFEKAEPGIKVLAKLIGVSSSLVGVIQGMANLKFYEYEVVNGKMKIKSVRQMNPDDFKRVGQNLGSMLNCLIEPLAILGSDSDSFNIGGMTITNPFKNSKTKKGLEMLSDLGSAFSPLVNAIATYSKLPLASDLTMVRNFKISLLNVIGTLSQVFGMLENWKNDNASDSIDSIADLMEKIGKDNTDGFTSINDVMSKFIDKMTDASKWDNIRKNLAGVNADFSSIAKSINSIDISKAVAFENNLKQLVDSNNGESLKDAIVALSELLGLVKNQQSQLNASLGVSTPTSTKTPDSAAEKIKEIKNSKDAKDAAYANTLANIQQTLDEIKNRIGITNSKLGGNLKVIPVGSNQNNI